MASSPAAAVSDQTPPAAPGPLPADLPVHVPAHLKAKLVADLAAGGTVVTSLLVEALSAVPDPRARRGVRHHLTAVLAIAACAVLTGATSYVAIAEWARASGQAVLDQLHPDHGVGGGVLALPCEATLRRCVQSTDAPALDAALAGWAATQVAAAAARAAGAADLVLMPLNARRRVISIDGKSLRGSAPRSSDEQAGVAAAGGGRVHLVSALDHASGVVLGQVAATSKGGEVAAAATLIADLDTRGLLIGSVITADAGFTARDLAADILTRGGHWILRIRGNQKILHTRLKALTWKDVPEADRVHSIGHGRIETRTIRVIDLADSSDTYTLRRGEFFPGAQQAMKIVRRRRGRRGRWSVQTLYAITSLGYREADPALLATWVRGHWAIEAMHWVRDVTFQEDASQVRTGTGPQNLAALRVLAISALRLSGWHNIAAGLREHARTPLLPLTTLGIT